MMYLEYLKHYVHFNVVIFYYTKVFYIDFMYILCYNLVWCSELGLICR